MKHLKDQRRARDIVLFAVGFGEMYQDCLYFGEKAGETLASKGRIKIGPAYMCRVRLIFQVAVINMSFGRPGVYINTLPSAHFLLFTTFCGEIPKVVLNEAMPWRDRRTSRVRDVSVWSRDALDLSCEDDVRHPQCQAASIDMVDRKVKIDEITQCRYISDSTCAAVRSSEDERSQPRTYVDAIVVLETCRPALGILRSTSGECDGRKSGGRGWVYTCQGHPTTRARGRCSKIPAVC
jgi:hypothetical protein